MRAALNFDYSKIFNRGEQAKFMYRAARFCELQCWSAASVLASSLGALLTGADLSPKARISDGVKFSSTSGVVIGPGVVIEDDVEIQNGASILPAWDGVSAPVVKKGAKIGSGARIVGAVVIEEGEVVAPMTVIDGCRGCGGVKEESARAAEDEIPCEVIGAVPVIEAQETESALEEKASSSLGAEAPRPEFEHHRSSRGRRNAKSPDSIQSIEIPQFVETPHKKRGRPRKDS